VTRDSITIDYMWQDRRVQFHDTAGMRKKAKVQNTLEVLSVQDTLRAIKFAQVVVLLMDATSPFDKQDLQCRINPRRLNFCAMKRQGSSRNCAASKS